MEPNARRQYDALDARDGRESLMNGTHVCCPAVAPVPSLTGHQPPPPPAGFKASANIKSAKAFVDKCKAGIADDDKLKIPAFPQPRKPRKARVWSTSSHLVHWSIHRPSIGALVHSWSCVQFVPDFMRRHAAS